MRMTWWMAVGMALAGCNLDLEARTEIVVESLAAGEVRVRACQSEALDVFSCTDAVFELEHGGQTIPMRPAQFNQSVAVVSGDVGGEYVVIQHQEAPLRSTVSLPDPFELESPVAGQTFASATRDLEVVWSNASDDTMRWSYEAVCSDNPSVLIARDGRALDDEGAVSIAIDDLELGRGECVVRLSLERVRGGEVDPAYGDDADIEARQVRRVSFVVAR